MKDTYKVRQHNTAEEEQTSPITNITHKPIP